jgi:two-component system, OmpR family, sensor histidine kinase KdpD
MGPQVASLIKNNIGLDSVVIFDSSLAELYTAGPCTKADEELARNTYVLNTNHADQESLKWQRVLRVGLSPIGAIVMSGIDLTPLMVDAIASLVTAAFERARSFEKESQAEAARQNEQLRTAVLDSLAHAFKTPLTVILTSTSGLLEMKHLNAVETELVDLIDQHATKLTALTTHLLRMAKLESSEVRLRPEEVSIPQLIDEILQEYSGQLCDHSVYVRIANEDLQILADHRLLTMTITEFIVNAAKYSSAGSSISISARTEGSRVVISVHNDGSSIDREERERIFERFYRSPATKHRASGSGIGLSVAKKTAEAHHGNVWVSSDKRTGTTFFLSLPALVKEGM